MRIIKDIFIHCSAGYGDVEAIKKFWLTSKSKGGLGWKSVGYHFFIYENGKIEQLADLSEITNGVLGFNQNAIHISYQGGVERGNVKKAKDTRTPEQKKAIIDTIHTCLQELKKYQDVSNIKIRGHRDASPDKNKNGVIESWERIKECPSFDAIPEYKGILSKMLIVFLLCTFPFIGCKSSKEIKSTTIVNDSTSTSSTYQERDTNIVAPPDRATTFIQCEDSNAFVYTDLGRVQIDTTPVVIKGHKQASMTLQKIPGTSMIKIDCECDTLGIQAKIRDSFVTTNQSKSSHKTEYVQVKYIPKIVKIFACIGAVSVLCVGLFFSFKIIKLTL